MSVDSGIAGDNVIVRNADGTFVSYFRLCNNEEKVYQVLVETGQWDYADGVETTVTLTVDGQNVDSKDDYYHERYRVTMPSKDRLILQSLKTGSPFPMPDFVSTRMDGKTFHLPVEPCSTTARLTTI